jgi:hypothetical protein
MGARRWYLAPGQGHEPLAREFSEISVSRLEVWEAAAMEGTEKAGYIAGIRPEGYW